MPPIPEPARLLSDGQVGLRLAAERDIPEILIAYQDDPELHRRLGQERPPSGAELGRSSERADGARDAGAGVTLTIVEPGSDDCRGQVYAVGFDWDHRRAEIGIWLAPQVRGRGYAARALRLAARWLFEACGLERLQILTHPDNEPMLRAAAAAGFMREGVLRGYERERGRRIDLTILSMLPGEA